MWTRRGARHRGHLLFAARCTSASQPRHTACGQCQRHGGARECASCVGHGELKASMHTEQSSPAHSGSGGAAGTHPRGSWDIDPKAASAVARSPNAWRRCSSSPATHTCPRSVRAVRSRLMTRVRSPRAAEFPSSLAEGRYPRWTRPFPHMTPQDRVGVCLSARQFPLSCQA